MSTLRTLEEIRAAGAALASTHPPLTEEQIERLAFLIAPTVAAPAVRQSAPDLRLSKAA